MLNAGVLICRTLCWAMIVALATSTVWRGARTSFDFEYQRTFFEVYHVLFGVFKKKKKKSLVHRLSFGVWYVLPMICCRSAARFFFFFFCLMNQNLDMYMVCRSSNTVRCSYRGTEYLKYTKYINHLFPGLKLLLYIPDPCWWPSGVVQCHTLNTL